MLLRRKGKPRFSRETALTAYPVRNRSLEYQRLESGELAITVRRRSELWARLLSKVFVVPRQRQVLLDEVGADIWELCDGEHTVRDLVAHVARKYQLNRKEAEVSLTAYLRNLGKRGLVGFAVPAAPKEGELAHAKSKHR